MASLQQQYTKRLHKEFVALQKNKPSGITLSLVADNLHMWQAVIPGPQDSLYAGGTFTAQLVIPEEYPLKPPAINFDTATIPYHLNVHQKFGQVCLGFLTEDNWSPAATSMEQIVNALFSLLARPEPQNSMDHELLNQYTHYLTNYEQKARESAKRTPR
ncbi:ubiquitin-conjugating enzyme E2 4-like [Mizuhopecten yessoensis]|uniref:ubiquitin-conjugating enzyme E2 4-like n=1 Tax=Mizuhopecten yessoensis TaxID=6573 RepID=UPI000B45AB8A|nr:ubiquitin-conjugating enzyme E2 4-like [Mizuhopecten yessoensis]